MPLQMIESDLKKIANDKCDYFSMVMVSKGERNGVLAGRFAKAGSVASGDAG